MELLNTQPLLITAILTGSACFIVLYAIRFSRFSTPASLYFPGVFLCAVIGHLLAFTAPTVPPEIRIPTVHLFYGIAYLLLSLGMRKLVNRPHSTKTYYFILLYTAVYLSIIVYFSVVIPSFNCRGILFRLTSLVGIGLILTALKDAKPHFTNTTPITYFKFVMFLQCVQLILLSVCDAFHILVDTSVPANWTHHAALLWSSFLYIVMTSALVSLQVSYCRKVADEKAEPSFIPAKKILGDI